LITLLDEKRQIEDQSKATCHSIRFYSTATILTSDQMPPGIYAYVVGDETTNRWLQSGKVVIE
jgi:hypothetical protein